MHARPVPLRLLALLTLALPTGARAEGASTRADGGTPVADGGTATLLEDQLALLASRRLLEPPATRVSELDAVRERAHVLTTRGQKDEALLLLLEAVRGPRYRSFESLDAFADAELMLTSLLIEQRALGTAQRTVERLLARGPASPTFGPAHRRAVDIALARRDYAASAARLRTLVPSPVPRDAASELAYLEGLAAHDAGDEAAAERALATVTKESRFYASARYLRGSIAARARRYEDASAHFCAVRDLGKHAPRAAADTSQLFPTQDLAQLALGRIAHEQGRTREAFDDYFRVPADSPQLSEALFEASYTSYERGQPDVALDGLAQLEARYPRSPHTAEARVLRGYVLLARCDFEGAERELVAFEQTFGEVLATLDAALASPARARRLFRGEESAPSSEEALLRGLLVRDPEVEHLRASLAALDAELARSSRLDPLLVALKSRVRSEQPASRAREEDEADDEVRARRLRAQLVDARAALTGLERALRALPADERRALTQQLRALEQRCDRIERALRSLARGRERTSPPPLARELAERIEQERAYVDGVRSRATRLRAELEAALERAERRALTALRERLAGEIRRARIGRIDAVMGAKRKLELEIESLAAGRFPPEYPDRRSRPPALLRDDEEYWPFEGEDWPDELQERAR